MKWLWVVLLVSGWAALAVAQAFTVGRIEVVGNVHITAEEILAVARFEAGQQITRDQVFSAVDAISRLGYFTQVTPEVAFENDLVVVRFKVAEFPKIERITFEGIPPAPKGRGTLLSWLLEVLRRSPRPSELRLREILTENGVKAGEVLNRVKLDAALAALVAEYQTMDWATIQVVPDLEGADLVLEVQELVIVGHRFRGLSTIPEQEARKLVTVPVGEVGRISHIQETLGAFGRSVFFSSGGIREVEEGEGGLWLIWDLEERVLVPVPMPLSGIDLTGVAYFPEDRIRARIGPLPSGAVTNYDVLQALAPVYDYYRREGFLMAEFVGEGVEGGRLQVFLKEGRIARIEVSEGTRTAGWVIERVMDLPPGQLLTEGRFAAGRQALMALGYFEDVVLEPRWVADELILKVTVTDLERLGSIGGNVGFSHLDHGIVGNVTYNQKNVLGKAIDLSLSLERGLTAGGATTWGFSFRSHSFPVFDRVSFDLYRRESGMDPIVVTLGGGAAVAYPLVHYLDLSVGLTSEQVWELPDWVTLDPRTSIEVGIAYDDRDSPFFPRTGRQGKVSLEKAGTFAPGVEYLALRAELAGFAPLDLAVILREARAVLAWRAQVRWAWDLPERYRFLLGGVDTVRGAKEVATDRYGLLNSEFRIELAQGSWVALFGDVGATWDGAVKASLGVELAASVAGMFFRLALAWPTDRDPTWVPAFEFGMSPMF